MQGLNTSAIRSALLSAVAVVFAPVALAAEPLYIAPKLHIADKSGISPELLADCPFPEDFSNMLLRALKKQGGTFADGAVPTPKGRSLSVELADLSVGGNGFIGHQQFMRLRGTLYQDGRKVASFNDRAMFQDSGAPIITTACYEVRMALRAEAYYIGKWVKNPVDGAELKHMGEH